MQRGAAFDITQTYRYALWREWDQDAPQLAFILLNPSTADAQKDDPTLRRCIGFARSWGYGSLRLVNLFAYRTTRPEVLLRVADPVGPENDRHIQEAIENSRTIIAAWGNGGAFHDRAKIVLDRLLARDNAYCLGWTRREQPSHPLYLPGKTQPVVLRR